MLYHSNINNYNSSSFYSKINSDIYSPKSIEYMIQQLVIHHNILKIHFVNNPIILDFNNNNNSKYYTHQQQHHNILSSSLPLLLKIPEKEKLFNKIILSSNSLNKIESKKKYYNYNNNIDIDSCTSYNDYVIDNTYKNSYQNCIIQEVLLHQEELIKYIPYQYTNLANYYLFYKKKLISYCCINEKNKIVKKDNNDEKNNKKNNKKKKKKRRWIHIK